MGPEDVKQNLVQFARRWSLYDGTERAEAQTFLNELFAAYGSDRYEVGARFEEAQAGRFLDLIWPRVCLVEMKRPSEASRLATHREQAFTYWRDAADPDHNLPAPHYVVLCAFRRFEIWEPGDYPNEPRAEFDLVELPERAESLAFLGGRDPVFVGTQAAVTADAVRLVTDLFAALGERRAAPPDELRDLMLQCVWCMFAEDLGQLPSYLFTRIVDDLIAHPRRSSADDLGQLFEWLDRDGPRPGGGLYADTRYVNGALFRSPARVHLDPEELRVLRLACEYDWRKVEPHIFGSLLEGSLGRESQWALGAHYTHEVDIQKVIGPSIVDPWRARLDDASSLAQVQQLQNELLNYVVLDPACGSGNFLYIAYRELRRIEQRLHEKERDLRLAQGRRQAAQAALTAFFPLTNIKGIEINAFAVSLARVTLWMAHKLAVDELELDEATLPLENLSGIKAADALLVPWPRANVIVGNPPFHGDRHLRQLLGDDYIDWLKETFHCGVKDHCVYWFRKAQDHLEPGQRAGLVGTNSISQNRGRSASLNYIVETGGLITEAVSSQDWPGEASVDVSIVNWIKQPAVPPLDYVLDNAAVEGIDTALTASTIPIADVPRIEVQRHIAFQGFLPGAKFDIPRQLANELLSRQDAPYVDVVKPYLGGEDITQTIDQSPSRHTIDFGQMSLERAARYPAALDIVRSQAREAREASTSYGRNPHWWQYLWPRPDFRDASRGLPRFIAGTATAKRVFFVWCPPGWRPSNSTNMFALADDYAMGILTSTIHCEWASKKSSTLEDRIRYTPTSAFETFPWPAASSESAETIAALGRNIVAARQALCTNGRVGLNDLYNQVDEGAHAALQAMHRELDAAVAAAYGWDEAILDDTRERNHHLYELNREIVAGHNPDYVGPRWSGR